MNKHLSFHVTFTPMPPTDPNWPNGFWAVYAINGDDIAKRIKSDDAGKVIRRDLHGAAFLAAAVRLRRWPSLSQRTNRSVADEPLSQSRDPFRLFNPNHSRVRASRAAVKRRQEK